MLKTYSLFVVVSAVTLALANSTNTTPTVKDVQPSQQIIYPVIAEPVFMPIPRPKNNPNYCPRNETGIANNNTEFNLEQPLHCLEPNCGLGVYRIAEGETVEKCSYCNSPRNGE
jgi:hypothetical protein